MTKYLIGVAAVLFFGVATVQNYRIGTMSEELSVTRQQANHVAALQTKLDALEKQFAQSRGDADALKANVAARNDQVMQLETKIKALEEAPKGTFTAYNTATGVPGMPTPGIVGAVLRTPAAGTADPTAIQAMRMLMDKDAKSGRLAQMATDVNGTITAQYITADGKVVVQTVPGTGTATTTAGGPATTTGAAGVADPFAAAQAELTKAVRALVTPAATPPGPGMTPTTGVIPPAPVREKPAAVKPPKPPKDPNENF